MKVFRKVFAIAISLAAIAMATSAFAANATYDGQTKTIALAEADVDSIAALEGQVTMAVVPTNFGAATASSEIYYINQGDGAAIAACAESIGLKGELNVPANYEVRVGGENVASVQKYNIPVIDFKGSEPATATAEGRVGVKGTFVVNGSDVNSILVKLYDEAKQVEGSYPWNNINITSAAGVEFTFGLEIVLDDVAAAAGVTDLSRITITDVVVE